MAQSTRDQNQRRSSCVGCHEVSVGTQVTAPLCPHLCGGSTSPWRGGSACVKAVTRKRCCSSAGLERTANGHRPASEASCPLLQSKLSTKERPTPAATKGRLALGFHTELPQRYGAKCSGVPRFSQSWLQHHRKPRELEKSNASRTDLLGSNIEKQLLTVCPARKLTEEYK